MLIGAKVKTLLFRQPSCNFRNRLFTLLSTYVAVFMD